MTCANTAAERLHDERSIGRPDAMAYARDKLAEVDISELDKWCPISELFVDYRATVPPALQKLVDDFVRTRAIEAAAAFYESHPEDMK